jgi:hypothetical protein
MPRSHMVASAVLGLIAVARVPTGAAGLASAGGSASGPGLSTAGAPDGSNVRALEPPVAGPSSAAA